MCMVDDGDGFTICNETLPKARKVCRCGECGRDIAVGEHYHRIEGLTRGYGWNTFRLCLHCNAAAQWLVKVCDGYPLGAVLDDLWEHAREYNDAWLTRQVANMRAKWRDESGRMMPLPELPDLTSYGARAA